MIWKRFTRCAANVAATIGIAFLLQGLTAASAASAAEIKVMSTVAMSATLDELKAKFETATGNKVTIVYSLIADLRKRIQEGETADVMILSRAALDELQGQGKVASGSIVNLASSYVAIAVRAGAAKPDIGSVEALKRTLLDAKSIVYADPAKGGASGVYFAKVLDRLGIADQMKSKTILVPGAQAAEIVAKGEAEMGVAQASEIVPIAGALLVGPLPGDLNNVTVFVRLKIFGRAVVWKIHQNGPKYCGRLYDEAFRDQKGEMDVVAKIRMDSRFHTSPGGGNALCRSTVVAPCRAPRLWSRLWAGAKMGR